MNGEPGRRVWLIAAGIIPFPDPVAVRGGDPELRSSAELAILNTTDVEAELTLTIYYEDQEPVGPYPLRVPARRVRHIRFNDLIDPEAIRLDRPFGCLLEASTPVVVQFTRQDTRIPGSLALASTMAYPVD